MPASAAAAKEIAKLREQIELAFDVEDWPRADKLAQRLRELELENGTAPQASSGWWFDGRQQQASLPSQSRRSRSPRRDGDWRHTRPNPTPDTSRHRRDRSWQDSADIVAVGGSGSAADAEVIEQNKKIKHHLQRNQVKEAWQVLHEMGPSGIRANEITFNEFLSYSAKQKDVAEVFRVVSEMRSHSLKPNRVSASIVLKALDENTDQGDIDRCVDTVRSIVSSEGVDDILLSSMAEATVRVGYRGHRIYSTLTQSLSDNDGTSWSVQTCGSLIRAHGYAKDTASMWKRWDSILARNVQPTEVTTGCMVEQLVLNNQVDHAHRVIRDLDRRGFSECVNAVVYASLLKGYAREKIPAKVWGIYQEMKSRGFPLKIETYNALVGAFADCSMMDWVPGLFAEMYASGIAPTVRTFTRLAKGFCMQGDMRKAEAVMKEMRTNTGLQPDEIFYNTILDAYAQHGMVKDGERLFKKMEKEGLGRSKYTTTIMRKLNTAQGGKNQGTQRRSGGNFGSGPPAPAALPPP